MINHFASQSQTCQHLKIIFLHWKESVKIGAISGWTDEDNAPIRQVQIITYIIY